MKDGLTTAQREAIRAVLAEFPQVEVRRQDTAKPRAIHLPSLLTELPQSWHWRRLDEVCAGVFDCPHSTPVLAEHGALMARSQDVRTGVFCVSDAARVSEETYIDRTRRAVPRYGDLLYSREGTYFGIAAEVPADARVCLGQRMVLLRPDSGSSDFRFLKYWLNSPVVAEHIQGRRDGSVAERLNLPTIRALPIPVPPLEEQRGIAQVLGTLDDKIELNRKMNETLEAMARAIFQSWFVDFDPVRAKARGEQPTSMSAEIAALFPSEFEDSEFSPIPKGWHVETLGECATYLNRGLAPKYLEAGGVAVINQKCIRGGALDLTKCRRHDPHLRSVTGRAVRFGDVLVNSTGVGTLGRVAQVLALPEVMVADAHVTVIRAGHVISWNYLGIGSGGGSLITSVE